VILSNDASDVTGCLSLLVHLIHDIEDSGVRLADHDRATRARASAALHNVVMSSAMNRDDAATRHEARVLRLLEQLRSYCDQLRPTDTDIPLFVPSAYIVKVNLIIIIIIIIIIIKK